MKSFILIQVLIIITFSSCTNEVKYEENADLNGHTAPTEFTKTMNNKVFDELPFENKDDFIDAERGLIARSSNLQVTNENNEIIWNQPAYEFIKEDVPASANPSLWRQTKLNNIHGLFKVKDSIYQLRGFDLANMTLIEGKSGWIVIDPLTAAETAKTAIDFAFQHLEKKPITAIIFTHSHIDHFGGSLGIMTAEEAKRDSVRIIAPKGFMEEATSENIIAGIAMARRSMFMYGKRLARSERGHIGSGLGKGPTYGSFGILKPTEIINQTLQEKEIDGHRFVFQYAPESEAPAELTFFLPELNTFCGAEIVSHTMHNLYTLRGTQVRNAVKWSSYIDELITLFGKSEVYFGSHHWPVWGNEKVVLFLEKQRDLYKYIHDQTVRLFNEGLTPREISKQLKLPESLALPFANRGYYGDLRHNVKAVYQFYLGWYNGNPANLNPIEPVEAGKRYVELIGGAEKVLENAQIAFNKGEYSWVAELLNHLVFAEPTNTKAKELLAKTYDQLGYQSESAPWRDVYLTGAYELRKGAPEVGINMAILKNVLLESPVTNFFKSMAVRLNGEEADEMEITVKIAFTDLNETYLLSLKNSVLHHQVAKNEDIADATIKVTHKLFVNMLIGEAGLKETLFSDELEIEGSVIDLYSFFSLFDKPNGTFNIVTP